jgi:hypothetical protein
MRVRSARLLAKLPSLAAHAWAVRKQTIADDARVLSRRMSEQTTLNRRLIESKLTGEIDAGDYKIMREGVDAEIQRIQQEENALDSEASTMEELITQQDRSLWTSVESGNARASITRLRCKRSSIQRVWCTQ